MKHLGDITKINGYEVPIVDVVIGGSPCQDLSVANGNREGLSGERSGLFMEQIRIVKEMREHDRQNGRTDKLIRPRFLVWENVPGAFSSNKGEDFRIVLEEICRIKDPNAVVPRPDKWTTSGCIMADGYSVAWRVLDTQFWGVTYFGDDGVPTKLGTPQRRRRIALVADFSGGGAPEILFERKSVSGDIETFSGEGEGATEASQRDTGETISFQERSGKPGGGKGILIQTEHTGALSTLNNQSVLTHTHTHTSGRILYRRWADAPTVPAEQGRYAELYERTAESVDKREREKVGTLMAGDYKGVTSNQDIRQGLDKLVLEPIRNCGTGNTQKTK